MEVCLYCNKEVFPSSRKEWRWRGWSVIGVPPSAPHKDKELPLDCWDYVFHKECFNPWLIERQRGLEDLDKPLNVCKYFKRDGNSMRGWYIRNNQEIKVLAYWGESDISNGFFSQHTQLEDKGWADLKMFKAFLTKNGWENDWWIHRKTN